MLTFNLKKEWFNKIKRGEKTHEYREVKPYWNRRFKLILCDSPDTFPIQYESRYNDYLHFVIGLTIVFKCGYPKKDDKDKILKANIKQITIINGKDTDLKIDKPVYDIEFELIKEMKDVL